MSRLRDVFADATVCVRPGVWSAPCELVGDDDEAATTTHADAAAAPADVAVPCLAVPAAEAGRHAFGGSVARHLAVAVADGLPEMTPLPPRPPQMELFCA